jgi:hypothetical protein
MVLVECLALQKGANTILSHCDNVSVVVEQQNLVKSRMISISTILKHQFQRSFRVIFFLKNLHFFRINPHSYNLFSTTIIGEFM